MPNSKKKREKIQYDGQASSRKRKEVQHDQYVANTENWPAQTPWETQKALRLAKRIANGKTPENWARSNAGKQSKANVSNLSTESFARDTTKYSRSDKQIQGIRK